MFIHENINSFSESLKQYPWFCNTDLDQFGRFVVYVDKMDLSFISSVPDKIDGKSILFHFTASRIANKDNYIIQGNNNFFTHYVPLEPVEEEIDDPDLEFLISELNRLKEICGKNILDDLFFETHDNKNAITNHSIKFPAIRESMNRLYNDYGFDLIFEELDK